MHYVARAALRGMRGTRSTFNNLNRKTEPDSLMLWIWVVGSAENRCYGRIAYVSQNGSHRPMSPAALADAGERRRGTRVRDYRYT
jgi:hypothetical protein